MAVEIERDVDESAEDGSAHMAAFHSTCNMQLDCPQKEREKIKR